MTFGELLQGVEHRLILGNLNAAVRDVAYDSRKAGPAMLFVCLPGSVADGHNFVRSAYERGTRLFLCQREPEDLAALDGVTLVLTENTRRALALISARHFDYPARRLKFVGITGTKGKTSTSFMLKSIFECAGHPAGLIGSNGVYYSDVYFKLPNTTPESYELHRILKDMADAGIEYCFLEATSQGFYLHRTEGIHFDLALYTNISPDHISKTEHPTFEHYFNCKKMIFSQADFCFVNRDAELFDEIVRDVPCAVQTYGFDARADYRAKDIRCEMNGNKMTVSFLCQTPRWERSLRIPIPGEFSASNALAAVCISDYFGIAQEPIAEGLLSAVIKGRMELVEVPAPFTVMIDFAHNKLSVRSLMDTIKKYNPRRTICVFGLEGNRAHIRRFDSGEILGKTADLTILANASPRTDDPNQILADIATGIERSGGNYTIIPDRREAIRFALNQARDGDLILLVGKGNVPYEEVNGVNIPFSERAVVDEFFAERRKAGRAIT
ncbi:MAG: UDP-N-acetylmuramoyl-L-alanyl-D-glutamate--2,6-diaminopimelate ligase [Oscillospiraceae bacterium]|jgi:UDP-N-acetylmuramoyl-L-alanyl-D-glutamate--2,6-diaminopimelate ligase|nr:UDP-N-acetylmuramoyl-L-alanyl-D-glutamate--2,6-diaminopimelate ligase [Oscillospiraceae bacterium]